MKTRFRRRSSSKNKRVQIIVIGLVGILAVLFLSGPLGSFTTFVLKPVYVVENWFLHSPSSIPSFFRSKSALSEELEQLRTELAVNGADENLQRVLEEENMRLRALFQNATDEDVILASVLKTSNFTPYDTVLVDAGSSDGVVEGAVVFAWEHIPIGVVAKVFARSSLIELFTSPQVESMAYVFGPDTLARAYGQGGGILRIDLPQGLTVSEGDAAILPAVSSNVFGTVSHIERTESNPVQFAFVTQREALSSVRFVSIRTVAQPDIEFEDALEIIEGASTTIHINNIPRAVIFDVATSTEEGDEISEE